MTTLTKHALAQQEAHLYLLAQGGPYAPQVYSDAELQAALDDAFARVAELPAATVSARPEAQASASILVFKPPR